MTSHSRWWPVGILAAGVLLLLGMGPGRIAPRELREPLATIPREYFGYRADQDIQVSDDERRVAGMDQYISRSYAKSDRDFFTVYVGYYERQSSGKSIHSPKNCLPGGGWEPLQSRIAELPSPIGSVPVNEYLIAKGAAQALVLYWYQGRGRVVASEYRVKVNLLYDAAFRRRTDEALVRVVVPIVDGKVEPARELARRVAGELAPVVAGHLPA
ncbi:MAG TPA: EpsI family protein [Gemmatimonadales bacterium]|nr:EpsI family protein [Gemmatimonadales bacterium]